jgi:hypothetical protein
VYSSKIEGEAIELDSYIKHRLFDVEFQPDYTRKTDDIYQSYEFAKETGLSRDSLINAHVLLAQHILPVTYQGKFRNENVRIVRKDGSIEYIAAS